MHPESDIKGMLQKLREQNIEESASLGQRTPPPTALPEQSPQAVGDFSVEGINAATDRARAKFNFDSGEGGGFWGGAKDIFIDDPIKAIKGEYVKGKSGTDLAKGIGESALHLLAPLSLIPALPYVGLPATAITAARVLSKAKTPQAIKDATTALRKVVEGAEKKGFSAIRHPILTAERKLGEGGMLKKRVAALKAQEAALTGIVEVEAREKALASVLHALKGKGTPGLRWSGKGFAEIKLSDDLITQIEVLAGKKIDDIPNVKTLLKKKGDGWIALRKKIIGQASKADKAQELERIEKAIMRMLSKNPKGKDYSGIVKKELEAAVAGKHLGADVLERGIADAVRQEFARTGKKPTGKNILKIVRARMSRPLSKAENEQLPSFFDLGFRP